MWPKRDVSGALFIASMLTLALSAPTLPADLGTPASQPAFAVSAPAEPLNAYGILSEARIGLWKRE